MTPEALTSSFAALPSGAPVVLTSTEKTHAYGLWESRLTLPDGTVVSGSGISPQAAEQLALRRARALLEGAKP